MTGHWAVIIEDARQVILVATSDTDTGPPELIGYVHGLTHPAFHANGNVAWIEELVVDEEFRGAGIGSSLMAAFEDWSSTRAVDARYLALATRSAANFYRSLGYQESATYFKKAR